jgi:twitching motility protein PilT
MAFNLHAMLVEMVERGATDLHLTAGAPPTIRIDGMLVPLDQPPLSPKDTKQLAYSVLTDAQKHKFEEEKELDLSFGIKGLSRFRGNCFNQKGAVAAAFRTIPFEILSFDTLGVPAIVQSFASKPKGLILVTGPTGSGKSTTLASLINKINEEQKLHIVTVEDPIEYLHNHKNCLVNQRELGADTLSFPRALKYVLRQDPDVILIGEMRDLETIQMALTTAETGHLTFATLHTNSAAQTINRIIDVFPPHQQPQIRAQLSMVLEGVVVQQLLAHASGKGRVLSMEVMIPTPAIRNLVREDKVHQIYSAMQAGQELTGMQTMNQSLFRLYQLRKISLQEALSGSQNPDELQHMIATGTEKAEIGSARDMRRK